LILKFKPLNLDVLPLYIVLMGLFPPVLWLMIRHRNWAMFASIALYLAARHFHLNLPSYPSGEWFFNPFTWQLLFVLGAWLAAGGARTIRPLVDAPLATVASILFLLFALAATLSDRHPDLQSPFLIALFEPFTPNDKTNLAPYRVIHLLALALLVVRYIHFDWPGLKWPLFRPVIKCGQQSLEVFCVGVFLSFLAHFVLETTSNTFPAQVLVGVGGLSLMTAVAYYRSWSKGIDKAAGISQPISPVGSANGNLSRQPLA